MRKIYGIVGVLVVLSSIAFIYFYHQPERMKREFQGVIYSFDNDFEKKTRIDLEGDYYKNLFGRDVFVGKFLADEDLEYDIKLSKESNGFSGVLTIHDGNKFTETIGSVTTSSHFDEVWIQLDAINERYNLSQGYISGPASTKDEGNAVAMRIQEDRP